MKQRGQGKYTCYSRKGGGRILTHVMYNIHAALNPQVYFVTIKKETHVHVLGEMDFVPLV